MSKAPRRFAEGTTVPIETTRADVERLLKRHGASGFMNAWDETRGMAALVFRLHNRMLRYTVSYPSTKDVTEGKRGGRPTTLKRRQEAEYRRRWRALHLILKAKLELVAAGDSSFDKEFLGDILLPDNTTVAEHMVPQLAVAYEDGRMPALLPASLGSE